jgi:hypothetical protein
MFQYHWENYLNKRLLYYTKRTLNGLLARGNVPLWRQIELKLFCQSSMWWHRTTGYFTSSAHTHLPNYQMSWPIIQYGRTTGIRFPVGQTFLFAAGFHIDSGIPQPLANTIHTKHITKRRIDLQEMSLSVRLIKHVNIYQVLSISDTNAGHYMKAHSLFCVHYERALLIM